MSKKPKKLSPTEQLKQQIERQREVIERMHKERATLQYALWDLLKDNIRQEIDERVDDRVRDASFEASPFGW